MSRIHIYQLVNVDVNGQGRERTGERGPRRKGIGPRCLGRDGAVLPTEMR
jgi:hypothetical protein